MILLSLFLIISLGIMIWACDYAIQNSVLLGKKFGLSDLFMGIFVIAIGTSLPEFAATIQAIKIHAPGIVAGNLVGSNIANILLVGGVMLLSVKSYAIENKDKISLHFFLSLSLIFSLVLIFNVTLSWVFIFIIIIFLGTFIYLELRKEKLNNEVNVQENSNSSIIALKVILSFVVLYLSSKYFVESAKDISSYFGISDSIVGVSIVALGTSLPEVITTIIAFKRNQKNLALGNIIGSCVANITVISLIAIILGSSINYFLLLETTSKLVFISTALLFYFVIKSKFANKIVGIIFLLLYVIYILTLYS